MSHNGGSSDSGHQASHAVVPGDFSNADLLGSDVENISWSTLFEGLKVNGGIRFFILFTAFSGWLYVIYWIRHHEPFSNQVIGVNAAQSPTAAADRSILSKISRVFPFQTPALRDSPLWAPLPVVTKTNLAPSRSNYFAQQPILYNNSFGEANQNASPVVVHVPPGQAISSPLIGAKEQEFDQRFGSPVNWRQ